MTSHLSSCLFAAVYTRAVLCIFLYVVYICVSARVGEGWIAPDASSREDCSIVALGVEADDARDA